MQRMSWLLAQHVFVHTKLILIPTLCKSVGVKGEDSWLMSLMQGQEVNQCSELLFGR